MKPAAFFLLIIICLYGQSLNAQNITGQYYGIGNVTKDGNYSQYLTELIINHKGNTITGEFNYYFKSSHVTSKVKGTFNPTTRLLKLELVPVLNYKAVSSMGADCPMQGYFILRIAKIETTLSGQFEAVDAYKYTCPSIFIKLKKEIITKEEKNLMEIAKEAEDKTKVLDSLTAARFAPDTIQPLIAVPEEPEVAANKSKVVKKGLNAKNSTATKPIVKPTPVATAKAKTTTVTPQTKTKQDTLIVVDVPSVAKKEAPSKTNNSAPTTIPDIQKPSRNILTAVVSDSAKKLSRNTPQLVVANNLKPSDSLLTLNLLKRSFEASPVIEVEADSIFISLYDNGEVDGDTVAVFHNRKLVLSDQQLSTRPINLSIPIDTTVHEISMYAENLGTIPPNTAICVIMAGGKRYELTLTSTFIRNGTIRFRKKTAAQIEREKKYLR